MAGFSIEKNGFISFTSLVKDIATEMNNSGGFSVVNADGILVNTNPVTSDPAFANMTEKVLLRPTSTVDSIANQQPWSVAFYCDDDEQWLDIYITGRDQVIEPNGDFRIATKYSESGRTRLAGKLTKLSEHDSSSEVKRTASFKDWGLDGSDTAANPMSYRLVVSNHGVSLFVWVESYDSDGGKFCWFVCQRMVTKQGSPVTTGKAPLFCVFSNRGYPDDDTLNAPEPDAVMKFVVRESDINSPTYPVTALEDTADSARIINGAQQVSVRENNNLIMTFPNGLNTQRYGYPHQLDMLGIISADIVSQSTELEVNPFSEATARTYIGMNSDHLNNKGIRIMFWIAGGSLD